MFIYKAKMFIVSRAPLVILIYILRGATKKYTYVGLHVISFGISFCIHVCTVRTVIRLCLYFKVMFILSRATGAYADNLNNSFIDHYLSAFVNSN